MIPDINRLMSGWDGPMPSFVALHLAERGLMMLEEMGFPPDRIAPSAEGGIAFTWRRGERDANIEFFNDGEVLTGMYAGWGEVFVETVGTFTPPDDPTIDEALRSALEKLRAFVEAGR